MRGSEGGEGCWMFGGSRGGSSSAQLRADVLQIPSLSATHFASHVQMFKPFESHQPAPSPHVSPRIGAENTLFFFRFFCSSVHRRWSCASGRDGQVRHQYPNTVPEWYHASGWADWAAWRVNPGDGGGGARQGHGDSSKHDANRGGKVSRRNCKSSSRCWLKRHICFE